MSISNGHASPIVEDVAITNNQTPRSESDLSDLQEVPGLESHPVHDQDDEESMDDTMHDMATSESDQEEDVEGEDDADFDIETPPAETGALRRASSSSHDSSRPAKRKASMDDDEFMMQNPELYGLRRSVRTDLSRDGSMANTLPAPCSPYPSSRRSTGARASDHQANICSADPN